MVRRLVEDEQVHGFEQKFQYGQSGALSTGQHLHLLRALLASEHEGAKQVADFQAYLALGYIVDGLEHCQFAIQQRCLVLREVANLHVVAEFQFAFVLQLLHDALHQRGLALAITTHEGNLVTTLHGEVHSAEYLLHLARVGILERLGHIGHHHRITA